MRLTKAELAVRALAVLGGGPLVCANCGKRLVTKGDALRCPDDDCDVAYWICCPFCGTDLRESCDHEVGCWSYSGRYGGWEEGGSPFEGLVVPSLSGHLATNLGSYEPEARTVFGRSYRLWQTYGSTLGNHEKSLSETDSDDGDDESEDTDGSAGPWLELEFLDLLLPTLKTRVRNPSVEDEGMGGSIYSYYLTAQPVAFYQEISDIFTVLRVGIQQLQTIVPSAT